MKIVFFGELISQSLIVLPWPDPDVKMPFVQRRPGLQNLQDVLRRRCVLQLLIGIHSCTGIRRFKKLEFMNLSHSKG